MELTKEVYFTFDIYLPNPEVFLNYSKTIKFLLLLQSLPNSHQEQKISLLSIIIYEASHKIILFRYVILIHENKQQKLSIIHLAKNYSSIYEENDLDGDLKIKTFDFTQWSFRIKRTTLTIDLN